MRQANKQNILQALTFAILQQVGHILSRLARKLDVFILHLAVKSPQGGIGKGL